MNLFRLTRNLLKTNLLMTLKINFRMLPWEQARKLPIYVYGKMKFRNFNGRLVIDTDEVHSGMIKIGKCDYYVATAVQQSIWNITGTLIFRGPARFMQGSYILVAGNATLEFGARDVLFGTNLRIFCFDHIVLGDHVRVAWDVQIMDTSFHYIELKNKGNQIKPLTKPVIVNEFTWIGNRSTISKGAVLPPHAIVSSNSMVNRDFSDQTPDTLFVGVPAEPKVTGCHRVFDETRERELDAQFHYTRTHL